MLTELQGIFQGIWINPNKLDSWVWTRDGVGTYSIKSIFHLFGCQQCERFIAVPIAC